MSHRSVRLDCEHTFAMAHPPYLKEKARQLRREKKLTIDELAERLALPRTTIYYWVRDLPVPRKPNSEWPEASRLAGGRAISRHYRMLREAAYDEGVEEFLHWDGDPTFREFLCMYIGEGYKRSRNAVSIANSNPAVMKLATYWLRRISPKPLWFSIQYHEDQDLDELREFWAGELKIPADSIRLQRKSNSGRLNGRSWRSEHGVLTAGVHDTYTRARLQAWIDWLESGWWELDSDPAGA
jgi:transcriptional regulator with XRE-family HTH domain